MWEILISTKSGARNVNETCIYSLVMGEYPTLGGAGFVEGLEWKGNIEEAGEEEVPQPSNSIGCEACAALGR